MARQVTLSMQPNGTYRITRQRKKRRPLFRVVYVKMKIFIWNLSPLHWYEDFKEIKINMDEFACKKLQKDKK